MVAALEMKGNIYYFKPHVFKQYNSPSLRRLPKTTHKKNEGCVNTELPTGNLQHAPQICQLQALRKTDSWGRGLWLKPKERQKGKQKCCGACLFLPRIRDLGLLFFVLYCFFSLQVKK